MPPSPLVRCSPGREHRMENIHKRGRSFESGLILRGKDDDLALFSEMQNKERDGFLLHTNDDLEDSLTKLRYSSDIKLGITIPIRGESSDLLDVDGEKNDYDWLLTPPDTPLFPSLDDDEPQQQNLPPRGRPRSQPINISRSSTMADKTHRTNRSSASPRRLSPSPRSSNGFPQLRPRPSSVPRGSPPPVLRQTTPLRRPSTPPTKPSTPTPRSSTPTFRRMSTGSSGQVSSSGRRGASPMRSSRGNSASPKLQGWQSNIPGFSSEAPPNLRTSLSDRPAPHMRGLSPTSRSGRGRQSTSPTASRSASSSHSHERDHFSSYSKGSVVSSGDDDIDSVHSGAISISPPARKIGTPVNSKPMAFSKKPSRTSPSSSVPKRSFDSVLRQMDHRKTPQNMFRPLLSSVPATTFYSGKVNSLQRPIFSRNSSLTTSTSASSEHGASIAPDMEGSEHDHNDLAGEWEKTQDPNTQEEVFIFDKVDDVTEGSGHELFAENPQRSSGTEGMTNKGDSEASNSSMANFDDAANIAVTAESIYGNSDHPVVDGCDIVETCCKCGRFFRIVVANKRTDVCQECEEIDRLFTAEEALLPQPMTREEAVPSNVVAGMDRLCNGVPGLSEKSSSDRLLGQHDRNVEQGPDCLEKSCPLQLVVDQTELHLSNQHIDSQQEGTLTPSDSGSKLGQTEQSSRVDNPEGTGISVLLLQRSSSSKWPVVQGRAFSATNILCSEPSYVRDNSSAMKRSFGRDSASASSSADLGSSRQMEARIQRQLSSRRNEIDSVRSDADVKAQCIDSHPDIAINAFEPLIPCKSDIEGVECEAIQESMGVTEEHGNSIDHMGKNATQISSVRQDLVDGNTQNYATGCMASNTYELQLLDDSETGHREISTAGNIKEEDCLSCINADENLFKANGRSIQDRGVAIHVPDSFVTEEECVLNGSACQTDIPDAVTSNSSVMLESQYDLDRDSQMECSPSQIPRNVGAIHEHSVSTTLEKDVVISTVESSIIDHADDISEESTVVVKGPRGQVPRSLTLEEATDTILFCSSIIHDIAYKAASIGLEKELVVPPEASRPTVTILGKSLPDQNNSRKTPNKRRPSSPKFRRRRLETQTRSPPRESENNVTDQESKPSSNSEVPNKAPDSMKPPKLESKCNCTVM